MKKVTRRFEGKTVIVTGASYGIGRATAEGFAREGAHVVICARGRDKLEEAAVAIRADGGQVSTEVLDLADLEAFAKLINDTANQRGLDVLVNNAAVTRHGPIATMSIDNWRKNFSVTADATFVGVREAMKIMIGQRHGAIVNVSSTCGSRAAMGVAGYSAAKAALTQFTSCAAMEAAAYNVRINTVIPGSVDTPANRAAAQGDPEVIKALEAAIPMQRSGRPEELAAAILFLASDDASFITGAELPVDGGKLAQLYVPAVLK
ncbi:MAG: SDR family oxidoreductase [Gammaproteobacteria bacterium]|nr:SDR family oxidoreductase [Gammaproteobacteria bacterium]MDH3371893.1 SDR family oxidoreductase [Gammaproteobacteria bacterium]MDH3407778.1 SDR family oxidoreductase [Gammaproteobacteria bacterium]